MWSSNSRFSMRHTEALRIGTSDRRYLDPVSRGLDAYTGWYRTEKVKRDKAGQKMKSVPIALGVRHAHLTPHFISQRVPLRSSKIDRNIFMFATQLMHSCDIIIDSPLSTSQKPTLQIHGLKRLRYACDNPFRTDRHRHHRRNFHRSESCAQPVRRRCHAVRCSML